MIHLRRRRHDGGGRLWAWLGRLWVRIGRTWLWTGLALSAALTVAWALGQSVADRPSYADRFGPGWLPLVAAGVAAAAFLTRSLQSSTGCLPPRLKDRAGHDLRAPWRRPRIAEVLTWTALLLMVWAAGGLEIDLLRVVGLVVPGFMPAGVDWPGLVIRALALASVIVLARLALARASEAGSGSRFRRARPASWYGYAALALALTYPIVKTCWALGWSVGLDWSGAGGHLSDGEPLLRFALWLPAVPWLLAAVLSLLLVSPPRWMSRRLLLIAGWSATAIVATVGSSACWSLVGGVFGDHPDFGDIAPWVFALFYGSWFLWAIAACAATRSYQLRSAKNVPSTAPPPTPSPATAPSPRTV